MKERPMSNQTPPDNKRISKNLKKPEVETKVVRIEAEDHDWLKETAYVDRVTMKDLVAELIKFYKENNQK